MKTHLTWLLVVLIAVTSADRDFGDFTGAENDVSGLIRELENRMSRMENDDSSDEMSEEKIIEMNVLSGVISELRGGPPDFPSYEHYLAPQSRGHRKKRWAQYAAALTIGDLIGAALKNYFG